MPVSHHDRSSVRITGVIEKGGDGWKESKPNPVSLHSHWNLTDLRDRMIVALNSTSEMEK